MSDDEVWGQLVSLTDFETEPISLSTDRIVIGRAADSDVCLSENKLVSGHHCFIQRDKDGAVSLHDSSTNGTLLNLTYKISKGKSKALNHGDEFYIVYKKNSEENNVGYIFQDIEELRREEGTQEYSPPNLLEATLEDIDCNHISPDKSTANKRKAECDINDSENPSKLPKIEREPSSVTEKVDQDCVSHGIMKSSKDLLIDSDHSDKDQNKNCDKATIPSNKHAECSTTAKDFGDDNAATNVRSESAVLVLKESTVIGDSKGEVKPDVKATVPVRDDIEENLQCMICQEIMHDCISLQPCLHSFCAGCYSDWMKRSNECPTCRMKVERINKNHMVNNLIEAYLKEHPDKKRPEEDVKELDGKNKITHDMLYPKAEMRDDSETDYSDDDDDDDDDDDNDDDNDTTTAAPLPLYVPPPAPHPGPLLFGFGTPLFGATRALKTVCRQCPEYKDPADNKGIIGGIVNTLTAIKNTVTGTAGDGTGTSGNQPGTSGGHADDKEGEPATSGTAEAPKKPKEDVKVMPDPPAFVCTPNQNHVLCQCCLQPMPDRKLDHTVPSQQCTMCYRSYCHAYWGCRKVDCLGCIDTFKEMNFGRKSLQGIILDNQYESEIFRDYIDSKGMSVKDVLKECCKGIDQGHYAVNAQGTHNFTTNSVVCFACGVNVFKQVAIQYRKTIKKEEFPEAVRSRPDCYWGSKCRTQRNKPHHAKNFNHVCDQTRQF